MPFDSTNYPVTKPEVKTDIPTEILIEARRIIDEMGWCQGNFAEDMDGNSCEPIADKAASFCSLGAIRLAAIKKIEKHRDSYNAYALARRRLQDKIDECNELHNIISFNDCPYTTKEDVLSVFDKAIANGQ